MKKILITGASGFVGGFLVKESLRRGFNTYAGIRKSSKLDDLNHVAIHFFKADLSDKEALKEAFIKQNGFDYIIHNAGLTKTCKKSEFNLVNYQYTKNLVQAIEETGFKPEKFIYMSSLAAFGPGKSGTQVAITNDSDPKPISLYGKSKLKSELLIQSSTLPYIILRPTGVYGPKEKDYLLMYKSIKKGIETYVGKGEQYISFIYVKDLARLVFDAIESDHRNKSYFVSDMRVHTTKSFNRIVKKELNKKTIRIVFPKALVNQVAFWGEQWGRMTGQVPTLNTEKFKDITCDNWLCDSSPLIDDFGFTPDYNLKDGIHESITWYKQHKLL